MARDGFGTYSPPAGTLATSGTPIESAKYNAFVNDLTTDANTARPIVAGGTGATTAAGALSNFGLTNTAAEINAKPSTADVLAQIRTYGSAVTGDAGLLANIDATNIAAGAYRFDNTTTGTFPTGVAAADGGQIETWRRSATDAIMFLYHATSVYVGYRRLVGGTWGAWREVITGSDGAAQGDILVRGASAWARVAKGTGGQALVMNAGATAPTWASGAKVQLAGVTGTGAVSNFTQLNNALYRYYEFELEDVKPVNDGVTLLMRFSTDGGTNYDAGASDYASVGLGVAAGAVTSDYTGGNTALRLTAPSAVGNAAAELGVTGTIRIFHASNTSTNTRAVFQTSYENTNGEISTWSGSGRRLANQDTDAIRFLFSAGNIASGTIRLYGIT